MMVLLINENFKFELSLRDFRMLHLYLIGRKQMVYIVDQILVNQHCYLFELLLDLAQLADVVDFTFIANL